MQLNRQGVLVSITALLAIGAIGIASQQLRRSSVHEAPFAECDLECARTAAELCRVRTPYQLSVVRHGKIVCVNGRVDSQMRDAVIEQLPGVGDVLVLSSYGGDSRAGIEIAEFYVGQGVTVVVSRACASACANFLFLAGSRKFILEGGWVGFHGGVPLQSTRANGSLNRGMSDEKFEESERWVQRILAFYDRIGVDQAIAENLPLLPDERKQYA